MKSSETDDRLKLRAKYFALIENGAFSRVPTKWLEKYVDGMPIHRKHYGLSDTFRAEDTFRRTPQFKKILEAVNAELERESQIP
jgi:hypothetical protein